MRVPLHASIALLGCLAAGCPPDPVASPDAARTADEDAHADLGTDAWVSPDDAYACPMPGAGRWVIGTFTYSGPDCTDTSSIDLEYHPVAFTVGADGGVTGCECETAGDTCEVLIGAYAAAPPCMIRLACRDNSMNIYFESSSVSRVLEHRLSSGAGTCLGSGPFTRE